MIITIGIEKDSLSKTEVYPCGINRLIATNFSEENVLDGPAIDGLE